MDIFYAGVLQLGSGGDFTHPPREHPEALVWRWPRSRKLLLAWLRAPRGRGMRVLLLLCLAALATSSSVKQEKGEFPSMLEGGVPPDGDPGVRGPTHEPVSQLQADFTLLDRGSGLRVEVFCQASSGSPPITYRLVRRNGHIHMQQTRNPGQPANFSFPLNQTSAWFRCQAENNISVQHTPFTLVPPGELPQGPTFMLAGCLISIIAIFSWKLSRTKQIRSGKTVG
ncbi:protein IL-40 [Mesoplodon densirostris]|uniref:protein IL-40 n=1 Tax=Mesoplodon densirostris TaxID=48708 RepID=UPI0028DC6698|nr:protein IL-40 [Mesoplodon densirostris]